MAFQWLKSDFFQQKFLRNSGSDDDEPRGMLPNDPQIRKTSAPVKLTSSFRSGPSPDK